MVVHPAGEGHLVISISHQATAGDEHAQADRCCGSHPERTLEHEGLVSGARPAIYYQALVGRLQAELIIAAEGLVGAQ
jgi:hypothetical protein